MHHHLWQLITGNTRVQGKFKILKRAYALENELNQHIHQDFARILEQHKVQLKPPLMKDLLLLTLIIHSSI